MPSITIVTCLIYDSLTFTGLILMSFTLPLFISSLEIRTRVLVTWSLYFDAF